MNDEHTAAYWMKKTMDDAHEAYERLKDTADFKYAIKEAEAFKQRMGICEHKNLTNGDRIRQMTDEELVMTFDTDCTRCTKSENCELRGDPVSYGICVKGNIEWLKQEVSEDAGSKTD